MERRRNGLLKSKKKTKTIIIQNQEEDGMENTFII